jgi:hypothetical protein
MIVFLLLIIGIYYFSRKAIKEIFYFLMRIFRNNHLVLAIITLILLPGTIIHELSHFLVALVLLLPVKSMSIFPEFNSNEIRLGEVKFEKRDALRSGLVGVAPFFLGILLLTSIFYFKIFPVQDIYINFLMAYVIFSVSSNMFSSSQDLKEAIYILPVVIIGIFIVYVFDIKLDMDLVNAIMKEANYYLFYVLGINIGAFLILKLFNSISRK